LAEQHIIDEPGVADIYGDQCAGWLCDYVDFLECIGIGD
jgi:hypothetical protein